ncbi:hypothetical protein HMPREF9436_00660 [Faecalibacterium cf. prausnitzii KLE1255]|uniref:Uncharacterized protein n=1 Tax=Faecalibacterium cf. prausnitzii KLE1255 TaxID=748224 RepID=E2ZG76_9FIRM|nr:hypothetical protein HMPREF9436_00660 [Faecalibacterium cf. prausnitzii KLE1255]
MKDFSFPCKSHSYYYNRKQHSVFAGAFSLAAPEIRKEGK